MTTPLRQRMIENIWLRSLVEKAQVGCVRDEVGWSDIMLRSPVGSAKWSCGFFCHTSRMIASPQRLFVVAVCMPKYFNEQALRCE